MARRRGRYPLWPATQHVVAAGRDTIHGGSGTGDTTGEADYLYGDDGDDLLYGEVGNDILQGDSGADRLYGGTGADIFVFKAASTSADAGADILYDFSTAQGDKLDLHDVLDAAFNPASNDIADFISFTNDSTGLNSVMAVDKDGTGTAYSFENVATLMANANLDVHALLNNGTIGVS